MSTTFSLNTGGNGFRLHQDNMVVLGDSALCLKSMLIISPPAIKHLDSSHSVPVFLIPAWDCIWFFPVVCRFALAPSSTNRSLLDKPFLPRRTAPSPTVLYFHLMFESRVPSIVPTNPDSFPNLARRSVPPQHQQSRRCSPRPPTSTDCWPSWKST